jgi:hypothetical protein
MFGPAGRGEPQLSIRWQVSPHPPSARAMVMGAMPVFAD